MRILNIHEITKTADGFMLTSTWRAGKMAFTARTGEEHTGPAWMVRRRGDHAVLCRVYTTREEALAEVSHMLDDEREAEHPVEVLPWVCEPNSITLRTEECARLLSHAIHRAQGGHPDMTTLTPLTRAEADAYDGEISSDDIEPWVRGGVRILRAFLAGVRD